jgi:signal transduction histidine kinase
VTTGTDLGGMLGRVTARDTLLPGALVVLALGSAPFVDAVSRVDRDLDVLGVALIVAVTSTPVLRRRWPVATLALVAAGISGYLALAFPYGPVMFALALAVYAVARGLRLLPAALAALGTSGLLSAHLLTNPAALPGAAGLLPALAWVAIPFTIGLARRLVAEAGARERAESDRRLLDAERLRLAQEVHDVVGHGLAAIQLQADIALHLRRTRPEQAGEALEAISRASAEALAELRATLAAIAPGEHRPDESRAPTPGLARLGALVARVTDAGVSVNAAVTGAWRALPPSVDLAAYRVLQESLTNVVKHSAHPYAVVEVGYRPGAVRLRVANPDLGSRSDEGHTDGFGIAGMRRRVAHLGGRLTAGPALDGSHFEVRATIPTEM